MSGLQLIVSNWLLERPWWYRYGLFVGTILVLLGSWWYFVYTTINKQIAWYQAQTMQQKNFNKIEERLIHKKQEHLKQIDIFTKELQSQTFIAQVIPENAITQSILSLAKKAQVAVLKLQRTKPVVKSVYIKQPVEIVLQASFDKVWQFLFLCVSSAILIKNMSLQKRAQGLIELQGTFVVYTGNLIQTISPREVLKERSIIRDIFHEPESIVTGKTSAPSIQVIGISKNKNEYCALITYQNKHFTVIKGERIDSLTVKDITAHKIIVQDSNRDEWPIVLDD